MGPMSFIRWGHRSEIYVAQIKASNDGENNNDGHP